MLEFELHLENTDLKVYHQEEHNILWVTYITKTPKMATVKEGWAKALELAAEHKILNWINDESQVELHDPKVVEWWRKEWFAQAMQVLRFPGKRHIAMVVSSRFYAEIAAKQSLELMHKEQDENYLRGEQSKYMETRIFKVREEAENWLLSLEKEPTE